MYKELDEVITKDGRGGTIVYIYIANNLFEIEFPNRLVETLTIDDLIKIDDKVICTKLESKKDFNYTRLKIGNIYTIIHIGNRYNGSVSVFDNPIWVKCDDIYCSGEIGDCFEFYEEEDDNNQFEDGFENEEYNYKKQKFEIGDKNRKFKKYGDFIMEKYKLIISDEPKTEFGSEDWTMTLDVSDLWRKFDKNQINLVYFIDKYKELLQSKKDEISQKTSPECWNKIEEIINKFDVTDKESVYSKLDEIYDIADKYGIKIKT